MYLIILLPAGVLRANLSVSKKHLSVSWGGIDFAAKADCAFGAHTICEYL